MRKNVTVAINVHHMMIEYFTFEKVLHYAISTKYKSFKEMLKNFNVSKDTFRQQRGFYSFYFHRTYHTANN